MRFLVLTLVVFFVQVHCLGQGDARADSMRNVLINAPDSVKKPTYFRLAWMHLRSNPDTAEHYANLALDIGNQTGDSGVIARATYYHGLINRLNGNYEVAIDYLTQSLKMYENSANPLQVTGPLFNLAVVYEKLGDYEKSLEFYHRELDIHEANDNPSGVGNTLNGIAIVNKHLENYDEALVMYERALKIFTELGAQWDQANVVSNMGNVYTELGRDGEAEKCYKRALEIDREIDDEWGVAYNLNNWGLVKKINGQLDSAETMFSEALVIRQRLGQKHEIAESIEALGSIYVETGRQAEGIRLLKESVALASEIGALDVETSCRLSLARAYKLTGQSELGYEQLEKYSQLKDSLLNSDKLEIIEGLQTQYDTEKKEKRLAQQQLEIERGEAQIEKQTSFNRTIIAVAVALVALLLLLLASIVQKRRLDQEKMIGLKREQELSGIRAMLAGEEKERSRIAKDLHDGLSGLLASVKMRFEAVRENRNDETGFDNAISGLDEASDEVRKIAHNMMPQVLGKFGLVKALEDFCANISASKTLDLKFQCFGMESRLNQNTELVLYRIIQELINNIIKHSGANEALVQISRRKNHLSITVEDNGRGFDANAGDSDGLGMSNLKTRVDYLKGDMSIDTKPQTGTSVYIELELERSAV